ncbi:MAG: TlpA family protein disulfide reductase [Pyrinomonadaceae bacterium]|nr:TlpA family protein disulfide reductase [Pyrinomonadaceae bacterium]
MLRFLTVATLLLLLASSAIIAASQIVSNPVEELPRADDASGAQTGVPDYTLETLRGAEVRLSSLRGRVVLLDFFTATCPHCKEHAPFVADLAKRHRDRGLVVLNMCPHNPYVDRELVEGYMRAAKIENDIVWSPQELFTAYMMPNKDGRLGVPQAVLFGADGRVVARFLDWDERGKTEVEQTIVEQLNSAPKAGSVKR